MKHVANQYAHPLLNRYQAIDLPQGLRLPVTLEHTAPPRARPQMRRAKARLKGWRVVEIAAEALADSGAMAVHLGEVASVLGTAP